MELTNFYIPRKSSSFFLRETFEFEHQPYSIYEDSSEEKGEFEIQHGLFD